METIALNKGNTFYINNQFLFKINYVRKWLFGKEKYQFVDGFGKTQLFFYIKNGFTFSEITFIENNLSTSFRFFQHKNNFFWMYKSNKYHVKQRSSFSYKVAFYKNEELVGKTLKNSFWKSYVDEMQFSFKQDINTSEIELYLILYAIHSIYFRFGD